jgi:hypothetical protein
MNYQNMLILFLLFLFSAFLFPQMDAALQAYTGTLQDFVRRLPLIWLASILVVMGYQIVGGIKD